MEPGDQVFCSYQEYVRYKQYDHQNKILAKSNEELNKCNHLLEHNLQLAEQKLTLKNALLCRQKLKTQYLTSLLNQIANSMGIKPETIGKGFKQIKDLDQTQFSVIRLPQDQIDADQRLPEGFSKSDTYMEIDVELEPYKMLVQCVGKQWTQKLKTIDYLEKDIDGLKQKGLIKQKVPQVSKQIDNEKQKLIERLKKAQSSQLELKKQAQVLKNKIMKLEDQLLKVNKQVLKMSNAQKAQDQYKKSDIKKRLTNLISEFVIYLSDSMMQMSLTAFDKKTIIANEIKQIEDVFKNEVKQLKI